MTRIDIMVAIDGQLAIDQHFTASSVEINSTRHPYIVETGTNERIAIAPPDRLLTVDAKNAESIDSVTGLSNLDITFSLNELFGRIPGQVNVLMARWFPERGWLWTRRGLVRHGPVLPARDEVKLEIDMGLRAMEHRAKNDGLDW